jgi:hypothetical protein
MHTYRVQEAGFGALITGFRNHGLQALPRGIDLYSEAVTAS